MRQLAGVIAFACAAGVALADTKPTPPAPKAKPKPAAPVQGKPAAKPAAKPGDAAKPAANPAPDPAGAPVVPAGDLVIGAYLSLTGPSAPFGVSTSEGIALAVEEQNRAGGVRGRKIVLRTLDTAGRSSASADAVTRLVTREGAIAILGEVASSATLAGAAVAQRHGVPMITPAATNPAVTEVGDMISRACMLDDDQAAAMASFVRGRLKLSRVAVLYDQAQPYSTELATAFGKALSRLGGTITGVQRYTTGDQDLQAQLEAIRDAKAQAVFVPGFYADVGGIAKQLRALGVTAPLLGTDGWDSPQLAQIAGAAIDGGYYASHFAADDPRPIVKAFAKQLQAQHGGAPDALAALGYDAARLLFDAMARARSLSGKDLAEAIAATKGFEGVTGSITMGTARNPKKATVILQLKAGKPVLAATIPPP